jgi:hypothetical protein
MHILTLKGNQKRRKDRLKVRPIILGKVGFEKCRCMAQRHH